MFPIAVLAGGLATRMRPLTENVPKALLPVAGDPFVFHQLRLLKKNQFTKVVFCINHLGDQIVEAVKDGSKFGLDVEYSFDGECQLGTGGAIYKAKHLLGEHFFITYGDSYLDCPYQQIQQAYIEKKQPALMTIIENNNQWDKSNVSLEDGEIICYDKSTEGAGMSHIDYGLSVLSSRTIENMVSDKYYDLSDHFQALAARKELSNYCVHKRFYEIGSESGLAELSKHLSQGELI